MSDRDGERIEVVLVVMKDCDSPTCFFPPQMEVKVNFNHAYNGFMTVQRQQSTLGFVCVRAHVRVCVRACVCVCPRARVCVWQNNIYIYTCIYILFF